MSFSNYNLKMPNCACCCICCTCISKRTILNNICVTASLIGACGISLIGVAMSYGYGNWMKDTLKQANIEA
jgi:hypothetical protein